MKRYPADAYLFAGIGLVITAMLLSRPGAAISGVQALLLSGGLLAATLGLLAPSRGTRGTVVLPQDRAASSPVLPAHPLVGWLAARRVQLGAGMIVVLALFMYAFFASTGTWRVWPETSRYYDDLGAAFRAGRLDLGIQPPAALLTLKDPYEPSVRNRVPGLRDAVKKVWDLTFYQGKLYVYWGPVPAMLLAVVKVAHPGPIPDQFLTFGFLSGLLVFSTLLLLRVRTSLFPDVPQVLVLLGVAVAALVYPIPWMLSHAAIYEASLSAGQCFLIGGLYFAYRSIEKEHPPAPYLLLASSFWALAFGSRLLMAFPVAVLLLTTLIWSLRKSRMRRDAVRVVLALGSPIAAGGLVLAAYNWLRFGSVLETGIRYTLTSENLRIHYADAFRLSYARPNLWLYLLSPIRLQPGFPFILPAKAPAWALSPGLGIYHVEQMTGLLYAMPFAVFALVLLVSAARSTKQTINPAQAGVSAQRPGVLAWLCISLAGSAAVALIALLLYFYVAIRFLADVVPSLSLLSVLGMWRGYGFVGGHPFRRSVYKVGAFALGLGSIAISLLLTMAESIPQFLSRNPHLLRQILRLFSH